MRHAGTAVAEPWIGDTRIARIARRGASTRAPRGLGPVRAAARACRLGERPCDTQVAVAPRQPHARRGHGLAIGLHEVGVPVRVRFGLAARENPRDRGIEQSRSALLQSGVDLRVHRHVGEPCRDPRDAMREPEIDPPARKLLARMRGQKRRFRDPRGLRGLGTDRRALELAHDRSAQLVASTCPGVRQRVDADPHETADEVVVPLPFLGSQDLGEQAIEVRLGAGLVLVQNGRERVEGPLESGQTGEQRNVRCAPAMQLGRARQQLSRRAPMPGVAALGEQPGRADEPARQRRVVTLGECVRNDIGQLRDARRRVVVANERLDR